MFQWMRDLTAGEKRTMAGCFGGWSLDALDVQIYSFVIPTLLTTWHISRGEAGLLGTVTLVVSAFGGWFAGALQRPLRPGSRVADHRPVVRDLHLPLRLCAEFRTIVRACARCKAWASAPNGRPARC